jgi:predicted AAA+ superfamily ATPase
VLLEDPDIQGRVRSDPRAFIEEIRPPVIFDEIQNAPELLNYVRTLIDGRPRRMGQWLFTGSQGPARLALKRSKTFKENGQRSFTS